MPQLTIKVDGELVRQGLQDLAAEIPEVGRLQIYYRVIHIKARMDKPAPKPSYPINWATPIQQAAFFASKGFGGGVPYVRRGAYEGGWEVVKLANGYRLINNDPGAKYVGGDAYGQNQSSIHAGRWPLFRDVSDEEVRGLDKDVQNEIRMVIRRHNLGA